jgi:hypothetical protein
MVTYRLWKPGPYVARSASDRTDDWPYWYVTPKSDGRSNCLEFSNGATFADRETAKAIAAHANGTHPAPEGK